MNRKPSWLRTAGLALTASCLGADMGHANQTSNAATIFNANAPVSTQASLDFVVKIGKFVFLRVGSSGTGISTVTFNGAASIPAGPTVPANGSGVAANWNGAAPGLSFAVSGTAVVPVQVQSNAGQVTLTATVATPLTNGIDTIPMSQITIGSDNAGLPPPPVPATGTGTAVNVTGTSFANLVTNQSANWTLGYSNSNPAVSAGAYNGQISFTASAP